MNEWYLGWPDKAVRHVDGAHALARRQNSLFDLAWAIGVSVQVHNFRGEFKRALDACNEASRLSATSGFPLLNTFNKIRGAWARTQIRETVGIPEMIQESLGELDAQKFYLARGMWLGMLSETQALAGRSGDAFNTVTQALKTNPDELIYRPELFRLRGELKRLTKPGAKAHFELAEQDFREAIEVARSIGAKSLELRAKMRLARLLAKQDRRDEARTMLAKT
jgi:adenylate cyclase